MTSTISQGFEQVYVHPSQFPDKVYQDYLAGFSSKQINHKFHYDSVKQSQKWLKIHETFSPAINSDDCVQAHEKCFQKTADFLEDSLSLQFIGLCCGGGKKDSLLASYLLKTKRKLVYYPVDVSLSLALISAQKVRASYPKLSVQPIVCDLLHSQDLILYLNSRKEGQRKIITFFGTLHNFCPDQILPVLNNFLQKGDILLLSTNLAPGNDYVQGIQQVLPQYDNELTKDWLITVLMDAGINQEDGTIKFSIEDDKKNQDLKRINADFEVENDVNLKLDDQLIQWKNGDKVQLFFSYRYTTPKLQVVLNSYHIKILDYWEAANQEEGIYFCQKI